MGPLLRQKMVSRLNGLGLTHVNKTGLPWRYLIAFLKKYYHINKIIGSDIPTYPC